MKTFSDQLGRNVLLTNFPPRRIVSLVPSQTELLAYLGLEREVVGITKFCVHPENWYRTKTRVGGTKQLHLERIEELEPDLIIGNKEENDREQITELARRYPVWLSDVSDLTEALAMIKEVGKLTDTGAAADRLVQDIQQAFARLPGYSTRPSVAYLIWRKPYMAVGGDTFINSMLALGGWRNCFADQPRYPEVSAEELAAKAPQLLFLSSEPYPFKEKHIAELRGICPRAVILLVNGELFSWYGSRLLSTPTYLFNLHTDSRERLTRKT